MWTVRDQLHKIYRIWSGRYQFIRYWFNQNRSLDRSASRDAALACQRPVWQQMAQFGGGVLLLLIVGHLLMNRLQLWFCQPTTFNEMNSIRHFQKSGMQPTVVYLGTSQILFGIVPEVVAATAAEKGVPLQHTYNLGVLAGDVRIARILIRDLLVGKQQPRAVVLGILPELMVEPQYVVDRLPRYGNGWDQCRWAWRGEVPVLMPLQYTTRGLENCLQWPLERWCKPARRFRDRHLAQSQGGYWLAQEIQTASLDETAAPCRTDWQQSLGPALTFTDRLTTALPALQELLEIQRGLTRRHIHLLVVLPPQSRSYLQVRMPPAAYAEFDAWFRQWCDREQIAYWDANDRHFYTDAYFIHDRHLNAAGAGSFSRQLGIELARHADWFVPIQ